MKNPQLESEGLIRDWHQLFQTLLTLGVHFSRLDVALDDLANDGEGILYV